MVHVDPIVPVSAAMDDAPLLNDPLKCDPQGTCSDDMGDLRDNSSTSDVKVRKDNQVTPKSEVRTVAWKDQEVSRKAVYLSSAASLNGSDSEGLPTVESIAPTDDARSKLDKSIRMKSGGLRGLAKQKASLWTKLVLMLVLPLMGLIVVSVMVATQQFSQQKESAIVTLLSECTNHVHHFVKGLTDERVAALMYLDSDADHLAEFRGVLMDARDSVDRAILDIQHYVATHFEELPRLLLMHLSVCEEFRKQTSQLRVCAMCKGGMDALLRCNAQDNAGHVVLAANNC